MGDKEINHLVVSSTSRSVPFQPLRSPYTQINPRVSFRALAQSLKKLDGRNLTSRLCSLIYCSKHQERFGKPNPATCRWRRQGALTCKGRCAGERSPERENLHGTFRRLMKVGGFFVLLVPHLTHDIHYEHPKKR